MRRLIKANAKEKGPVISRLAGAVDMRAGQSFNQTKMLAPAQLLSMLCRHNG
jgi:hypothetical protein